MAGLSSLITFGRRRAPLPRWMGEVMLIVGLAVAFAAAGSVLFWVLEPKVTYGKSLYWAIVTMTTVGYGDVTPSSTESRVVAVGLMFGGVMVLALISASIASFLVARRLKEGKGMSQVVLKDHLLITGWSARGELILHNLDISAPDYLRDIVVINEMGEGAVRDLQAKFASLNISYVHGDPTNDFVLARAGVEPAAVAIVLSTTSTGATEETADNRTIKVVMGLRSFSTDLKIFAEARHVHNEPHLRRAGVDEIISSAEIGATLLANAPLSPSLPAMIRELLSFKGNGFRTVAIPKKFIGRPLGELFEHFRGEQAVLVGVVTELKSMGLEDLMQERPDSFIDAFIKQQFIQAAHDAGEQRTRFQVNVNPPDSYVIQEDEAAMVISRELPENAG